MPKNQIVLVLGAGASSHFGYPLASELVKAMEKFIKEISAYNPLNIDFYLSNLDNLDTEKIGKKLIKAVLVYSQRYKTFSKSGYLKKWWKSGYGNPAFEKYKKFNSPKDNNENEINVVRSANNVLDALQKDFYIPLMDPSAEKKEEKPDKAAS
jgi:hypothetical protein